VFSIIPRDRTFYDLFEQGAAIMVRAAQSYHQMARDYARRGECVALIRQLEHDGDEIAHRVFDHLDQTFITPFDREDIQTLMHRMDDVIDQIDAAAKRMTLYEIATPTQALIAQTDVLARSCSLAAEAVKRLRNLKRSHDLHEVLVNIHQLENVGDDTNHAAVAELYRGHGDPLTVMKWKEIYDLTERAIDGCEDIANAIRSIMLKNA
jgi:hypothetical protein